MSVYRRRFLASPLAAAAAAAVPAAGASGPTRVLAMGDGVAYTPAEYAQLLGQLAEQGKAKPDNYSLGGSVEELEKRMAGILGKESAIWMATGTLANQNCRAHPGRRAEAGTRAGREPSL